MLPIGTCFCHRCGKTFQTAFYKRGDRAVGFTAVLSGNEYKFQQEGASEQTPEVTTAIKAGDPLPDTIHVRFGAAGPALPLPRVCPACKEKLPLHAGQYPTYIIPTIGYTASGKSSFLSAISYHRNLFPLNREGYRHTLDCTQYASLYDTPEATRLQSEGKTNTIMIRDGEKVVAAVLLLDLAGELFSTPNAQQWNLLMPRPDFPGADGFIFFDSAVKLAQEDDHAIPVFNMCRSKNILDNKYVAYVVSHGDKIVNGKLRLPAGMDANNEPVPILSGNPFAGTTDYSLDAMMSRMALEHDIANRLNPIVLCVPTVKARGFFIQSCTDNCNRNDMARFDTCFNVMDPIIWLLFRLGLFPLCIEREEVDQ